MILHDEHIFQILKIMTTQIYKLQEYQDYQKACNPSVLDLMRVGASHPNQTVVPQYLQTKNVQNTANNAKVVKDKVYDILHIFSHDNIL